ncbi:Heterokaryon incompatibility protein (HET) domain containing protein [Naviculisporaceae sp. PSN 640]
MRLINTSTLALKEFFDSEVPNYAILSHTWDDDEVSLHEMEQQLPSLASRRGHQKIKQACRLAQDDQLDWIWLDTCCIDKKSSAELTEAINSMFQWYKRSQVCYAYLSDWDPPSAPGDDTNFSLCRWFTRGWTLQELVAPSSVIFYDRTWAKRGDKSPRSLGKTIQYITGIPLEVLDGRLSPASFSVAQKMSWAAKRKTTRAEDMAYCLLGLFDINMPMIYGEGTKAFYRLQEQICKKTTDLTIFAWNSFNCDGGHSPLFASSPADFDLRLPQDEADPADISSADIVISDLLFSVIIEHNITNNGLRVEGSLARVHQNRVCGTDCWEGQYYFELGFLQRRRAKDWESFSIGILLQKCGPARFFRKVSHLTFVPITDLGHASRTLIQKHESKFFIDLEPAVLPYTPGLPAWNSLKTDPVYFFRLGPGVVIKHVIPSTHWDLENRVFFSQPGFRACVFALLLKIPLPGIDVKHPVVIALNQFEPHAYLFDGLLAVPGLGNWFLQSIASPALPIWSDFMTKIDSEKLVNRGLPPNTIRVVKERRVFVIKANISHALDDGIIAFQTQISDRYYRYYYKVSVISLSIEESKLGAS